ncbi:MAG TPA: HAMP domain-containing histidine kinase [Sedimenticola sp.]|nr:HAMP domain-containing histidine kinase [Sedimenticola sp.]
MTSDTTGGHFKAALALTIHDVKNSLALFLDRVEAVQALDENAGQKYAGFKYEIKRINNNLVRLLSLYKVDEDDFALQDDFHLVDDFFEEIAAEYAAVLHEKDIELIPDCADGLCFRFDKGLIYGVLDNAINNAARYTKTRIGLKASREEGYLVLSVQDDGDGYPECMLTQDLSAKFESGIDMAGGATGLGLYFSWIVAKLHKREGRAGYVRLSNDGELGGGCFSIHLPGENASFSDVCG